MLHLSKVAVGCRDLDALRARVERRSAGGEDAITTRFTPKRAPEVVGGSIYWIIKHRVVARQTVLGFARDEAENRAVIRLQPRLVPVRTSYKRVHQGWRYLLPEHAPPDFDGDEDGLAAMPPRLVQRLSALALV